MTLSSVAVGSFCRLYVTKSPPRNEPSQTGKKTSKPVSVTNIPKRKLLKKKTAIVERRRGKRRKVKEIRPSQRRTVRNKHEKAKPYPKQLTKERRRERKLVGRVLSLKTSHLRQ
jgi:hypothetical protein